MQYKINISDEAKIDIIKATEWYDNKQFGLGERLIKRIDEAILQIIYQPFAYVKIFLSFRKISTKQFSYFIYYYINTEKNLIDIIAILHTKRNPMIWKKRVTKIDMFHK